MGDLWSVIKKRGCCVLDAGTCEQHRPLPCVLACACSLDALTCQIVTDTPGSVLGTSFPIAPLGTDVSSVHAQWHTHNGHRPTCIPAPAVPEVSVTRCMPLLESSKGRERGMKWMINDKWIPEDEQWPGCCTRGGGDWVVSLVNLTADIPNSSSSGLRAFQWEWQGWGRNTMRNMWGIWGGASNKCCWNAPGMLDGSF